jgi:hypothetical protein
MIKYQKTNPSGVDKWINKFQIQQQSDLPTIFGVSEANCLFYGRAEMISDKPVVYASSSPKYEAVGFDTKETFISYFILGDIFSAEERLQFVDATLYCHGDLSKLFPTIAHRADEELRNTMREFVYRFIEPQEFKDVRVLRNELQPYHSFTINFKLLW